MKTHKGLVPHLKKKTTLKVIQSGMDNAVSRIMDLMDQQKPEKDILIQRFHNGEIKTLTHSEWLKLGIDITKPKP